MKITENEKQFLDSCETSEEIGIAIKELFKCSRIGSKRWMKYWDNPTLTQLEKIKRYAADLAVKRGVNPKYAVVWGR